MPRAPFFFHFYIMKDTQPKKKTSPPLFPLLQHFEIHRRDLLEQFLSLSKRARTCLDLVLKFLGNRNLAHAPIPETDGENPNRPVALTLALLAILTARLITTHHSTHQGTGQDSSQIRDLLDESFTGGGKGGGLLFHNHICKIEESG